jgi:hypothetical protein
LRSLHFIGHRIERPGQTRELVVTARGDAVTDIAGGNRIGRRGQRLHGSGDPAPEHPAEQHAQPRRHRGNSADSAKETPHRRFDVVP